jgi:pyrrolidone-carboxylate peptidase
MLYVFALTSELGRLLYQLKSPDCCYIVYGNNIDHYLKMLLHDQPSHILGLGSYSGVDQDKIRIETITTNRFRNDPIEAYAPDELRINNYLETSNENFKVVSALGNSYCNLISYKIMRLIEKGKLKSQYSFLHIPKGLYHTDLISLIDKLLFTDSL